VLKNTEATEYARADGRELGLYSNWQGASIRKSLQQLDVVHAYSLLSVFFAASLANAPLDGR
jgi:hypothetical protein